LTVELDGVLWVSPWFMISMADIVALPSLPVF